MFGRKCNFLKGSCCSNDYNSEKCLKTIAFRFVRSYRCPGICNWDNGAGDVGRGGGIKNVQTNEVSHCSVSNVRYLLFPAIEQCNFCQHGTACAASLNANPASLAPAEHTQTAHGSVRAHALASTRRPTLALHHRATGKLSQDNFNN